MALGRESVTTSPKSLSHMRVVIDRLRRTAGQTTGVVLPGDWTANGSISEGEVLYAQADSVLDQADASAIGTGRAIGIAREAASAGEALIVQVAGVVEYSSWTLTPNAVQYLSTTAGGLTETAPSATGEVVTVVGVAVSATELVLLIDPPILL